MKDYRVIAFDLDGTLADPAAGLLPTFAYALSKMGVDYGTRDSLRRYIGPPLVSAWREDFGFSEEELRRAMDYFHEYYDVYGWWDNTLYPGIPDLLAALKRAGKKVLLATSKPQRFAGRILPRLGLSPYFDAVVGALSDGERDKKWEVLSAGLSLLGEKPEDAVLIGDRRFDAEGAGRVGADAVGVLYGHGSEKELREATFLALVRTADELKPLLLG